ncbi:MAG: tetratricopeptide repeat protein [Coleofasciculus sp. S288]|nr:tetratricopeptide repeat protein [Coleofasciculus sp. S288]
MINLMSYCINPNCPNPADPSNASSTVCVHCDSQLLLQKRYRVKKQLGEGGFGKTYLVEDALATTGGKSGRLKVLKVLLKNIPVAVKLFQREAKVLSQLQNPGIPRVEGECFKFRPAYSIEPLYCLVMEFIEGCDLHSWLKSRGNPPRPISQKIAIAWLHQLIDILSVLHNNPAQQCFHRDIKPANIMRRPNGQLVLIDFGAVREVTPTLLVKAGAGQALTGICSPGYAPPEQIEGKSLPQSDFFALGRTMVHLLTGKHPLSLSVDVYTGQLLWRSHAPAITEPFADFIDDLMAPLPGKRPPNTHAIKQRLEAIEQGLIIQPCDPTIETIGSQTEIFPKKRQKQIVYPLSVAVTLLLGFIGFRWGTSQIAIAYHERGITHQIANELYLAQVDFQRALTLKPNYPEAQFHLGRNYELLGDMKQARAAYEKAKQEKLPEAYSNLARLDILEGNYSKAIPLLEEGVKLTQSTIIKYALLKNLGWAYLGQKRYSQAKTYLQQAINLNKEKASAYCLLAQVWEAEGKPSNALAYWESCRRHASRTHMDEKHWLKLAQKRLGK